MNESLGGLIGSYGIDRRYFFQQFVVWGIIIYLVVFVAGLKSPALPTIPALLIWFALYLMTVVILGRDVPRILLHDNGVVYLDGAERRVWYWSDLTHMTGTRTSYSVNAIPLWRAGENIFHAGKTEAFIIGATTANANPIANFVIMKMAELRIPAEIEKINNGTLLSFGKTSVSSGGITYKGQHYPWADIQSLNFRHRLQTRVGVKLRDNPKKIYLNGMEGTALYTFVGVADYYLGTKLFRELEKDTILFWRHLKNVTVGCGLTAVGMAGVLLVFILIAFVMAMVEIARRP